MGLGSVTVVLPTYNERENVPIFVREIHEALGSREHEILVVDDNSPDGTGQVVRDIGRELPMVKLINKEKKEGIGAALRYGYDRGTKDILVSSDADLSFSAQDMLRMIARVDAGADLVVGTRHSQSENYEAPKPSIFIKFLVSRGGNHIVRFVTGLSFSDYSANFRAMRRSVWRKIEAQDNTNSILLEMILKAKYSGFKVEEVPVTFRDRRYGKSKLNLAAEAPRFLVNLVRYVARYRFGIG